MKRQSGITGMGLLLFSVVMLSIFSVFNQWLEVERMKTHAQNYEKIAESQTQILKGLAKYFTVDCSDDGYVNPVTTSQLVNGGFLNQSLIHNPFKFNYTLSIDRATEKVDPVTGRSIPEGRSVMKITTRATKEQLEYLMYAYKTKELHYTLSGTTLTLRMDNPISDTQLEQDYLLGGASGSYYCR